MLEFNRLEEIYAVVNSKYKKLFGIVQRNKLIWDEAKKTISKKHLKQGDHFEERHKVLLKDRQILDQWEVTFQKTKISLADWQKPIETAINSLRKLESAIRNTDEVSN